MRFPKTGDKLRTRSGAEYAIDRELGRGAQGVVYSESSGRLAIKVYRRTTPDRDRRRRDRIQDLIVRGRSVSSALVMPLDELEPPHLGYVMERVVGYQPIGSLAHPPRGIDACEGYRATGGLRARLTLAERLVEAFRAVHLAGLAYGDLSFDNVLVPIKGRPDIRLIDCDNLVPSGVGVVDVQGTPWFMAPEVLTREAPPTTESDAHSLAVILFHLITLIHPLLGDRVREGSPDDEDRALRGELPWIDHAGRDENRTRAGMRRDDVFTIGLKQAFATTFEVGLARPESRLPENVWLDLLGTARDALVDCSCGHAFYLRAACSFCGKRRSQVRHLVLTRGRLTDGTVERRPVILQAPRALRARHLLFAAAGGDDKDLIQIRTKDCTYEEAILENVSGETLCLGEAKEREATRRLAPRERTRITKGMWFRLGDHGVRGELYV